MGADIVFLRGCGIIRRMVLEAPKVGVLNAHYGSLPKYRGVYATEWAVLNGEAPYVTMHFVDAGVDTGAILATKAVPDASRLAVSSPVCRVPQKSRPSARCGA